MSYEGYSEYLCENGHYTACDVTVDEPATCWFCGARWQFYHAVDQTNGIEEENPSTMPAPKREIGIDDDWRMDRHGNRYAYAVPRFEPVAEWRKIGATVE